MKSHFYKFLLTCIGMFFILLLYSCSSYKYIEKKTERLVDKLHRSNDTIYAFSANELTLLWYYEEDNLYGNLIQPYKTRKYQAVKAKNIPVKEEELKKYFDVSLFKDVDCFNNASYGYFIEIYIKDQERLSSGLDRECLFNNKFEKNSFPYKLQYDFSKILRSVDYNFEEMYSR